MKKAISFLLSAALLLGLAACGAVTPSPTASPESTPGETPLSDFTQPPELRVSCGQQEVTADEVTLRCWQEEMAYACSRITRSSPQMWNRRWS